MAENQEKNAGTEPDDTRKKPRLMSDGKKQYEYDNAGRVIKQTDLETGEICCFEYRSTDSKLRKTVIHWGNQRPSRESITTYDADESVIAKTCGPNRDSKTSE